MTIIDFYAQWCKPCKAVDKYLDNIGPNIYVQKVDVDKNPDLAAKYGVQSVPMLAIHKNGTLVDAIVGLMPEKILRTRLGLT